MACPGAGDDAVPPAASVHLSPSVLRLLGLRPAGYKVTPMTGVSGHEWQVAAGSSVVPAVV